MQSIKTSTIETGSIKTDEPMIYQDSAYKKNAHQESAHQGCTHKKSSAQSEAVLPDISNIRVNGRLIDEANILSEMQYHDANSQSMAMTEAVRSLIIYTLLTGRAQELAIMQASKSYSRAEEEACFERLIAQEVPFPQASEQECRHFFEGNQKKFTTSPLLEMRHILLAALPEDVKERDLQEQLANEMIAQLIATPAAFSALAEQHSACSSKKNQGQLGQISKGQTVSEFEKAVLMADEGLIPYPIESRYGFHVVSIDRRIEGLALPFEYVHSRISQYLNEKVQRKASAQYIQTLLQVADIQGIDFEINASPLLQ